MFLRLFSACLRLSASRKTSERLTLQCAEVGFQMILTLTPNPTIDRVYYLPSVTPDTVHRARKEVATPSGKGVDASIILRLLGEPTVALGFNAGQMGKVLAGYLDELDVAHDFVAAEGETRTVPVLVDESTGSEYTITAPSLMARPEQFAELLRRVQTHSVGAWGIIAAGSLPAGVPKSGYLDLIKTAKEAGLVTLLDTSGEGLRQCLYQSSVTAVPHILKINQMELADINTDFVGFAARINTSVGRPDVLPDFATALRPQLGTLAEDAIVISMGKRGALAVTARELLYAAALDVPVGVTNGAGDAMDTGLMLARKRGESWADALRLGTAMAAAAVMHEGTAGLDPTQIEPLLARVTVERL